MTRRFFIRCFGAMSAALPSAPVFSRLAKPFSPAPRSFGILVAGVPIIDTKIAQSATELARSVYSPYLFNHAMRTYIFGSLVGIAHRHQFDKEALYLACILHDLGLTKRFEGDRPFEIEGAEAARQFLSSLGMPKETIDVVWDGIALHASAVGDFKAPEIALVGAGAGSDVLGPDPSDISHQQIEETLHAYPRLNFKDAFLKTCAGIVERHPRGATRSFMRDIGTRFVPGFRPRNFCDLVKEAPFKE